MERPRSQEFCVYVLHAEPLCSPSFSACLGQNVSNSFGIPPPMLFVQREVGVGVSSLDSPLGHHHPDTQHRSTAFSANAAAVAAAATEVAHARALHAEQQLQQERTWSVHFMQGFERALRSFVIGGTPAAAGSSATGAASLSPEVAVLGAVAAPAAGDQQPRASASVSAFTPSSSWASAASGVRPAGPV